MVSKTRKGRLASGFTLVEVLVAMVIFALLMMLVSNAMSFSFGFWSRNHSQLDEKINNFIVFEKFSRAIKAAQPYGVKSTEGKLELFFEGEQDSLRFVSDIGLYEPGPSLVVLASRTNENGNQSIALAEQPMSDFLFTNIEQLEQLQLEWQTMFDHVRNVNIRYFGYQDLSKLNLDALNTSPIASLNKNKAWFSKFIGEDTLILPETVNLTFEELKKGQWVERDLSFSVQINDARRFILLNQHRDAA